MNGNHIENEFIKTFHSKRLNELTIQQQCFIKDIFPNINYTDEIISWKNNEKKKSDIFIKVNHLTKGISIKSGNENSMHSEQINYFISFLKELNISEKNISIYQKYHYGKKENDTDREEKYTAKELKLVMKDELKSLNKQLNKPKNIVKAIDRFVVHGIDTKYDIAALISGTPSNFVWLKSDDIYDFALDFNKEKYEAPHFGMLIIQPKKRDLQNTNKNDNDINRIQIKWHNLYENITNYYHQK